MDDSVPKFPPLSDYFLEPFDLLKNKIRKYPVLCLILTILSIKAFLIVFSYFNFDFSKYPWENWVSIWSRWDSKVYLTIANKGYAPPSDPEDFVAFLSHFPPLYPLLIKILSMFYLPAPVAGMLVSVGAYTAASYLLFRLVLEDFKDKKAAFLSAVFMNVYPISYFSVAIYSESLFIFFVILSFYMIRRERFIFSGMAGAGAILTRITGVNMVPTYVLIILRDWREGKFRPRLLSLLIIFMAGFSIYLLINQLYFGSFRYFLDETSSFNWTKTAIFPMKETVKNFYYLVGHISDSFADSQYMFSRGYNSIFTVLTLFFIILGIKQKIPVDYTVYSLSSLLFFSSFSWGISDARYTLPIFPMFISMALIKSSWIKYSLMIFSVFMLFYFTKIFTGGSWAF